MTGKNIDKSVQFLTGEAVEIITPHAPFYREGIVVTVRNPFRIIFKRHFEKYIRNTHLAKRYETSISHEESYLFLITSGFYTGRRNNDNVSRKPFVDGWVVNILGNKNYKMNRLCSNRERGILSLMEHKEEILRWLGVTKTTYSGVTENQPEKDVFFQDLMKLTTEKYENYE